MTNIELLFIEHMNVSSDKLEIFEHLWGSFFINCREIMEICTCENQIY